MNEAVQATGGNVLILPWWAAGILSFLLLSLVSLVVATWTRMEKRIDRHEEVIDGIPGTYQLQKKCGGHITRLENTMKENRADCDEKNKDLESRVRDLERTIDRCPNCSTTRSGQ